FVVQLHAERDSDRASALDLTQKLARAEAELAALREALVAIKLERDAMKDTNDQTRTALAEHKAAVAALTKQVDAQQAAIDGATQREAAAIEALLEQQRQTEAAR